MNQNTETDHRSVGLLHGSGGRSRIYKVKRIVVYPGQRTQSAKTSKRAEHWYVVSGEGIVTLDGQRLTKKAASQ